MGVRALYDGEVHDSIAEELLYKIVICAWAVNGELTFVILGRLFKRA